jgi:cbb3-type cytochrome oxidase subunit 3
MPLDANALIAWIIVTIAFIAVVAFLYTKVSRARAKKIDENKDEAPAY